MNWPGGPEFLSREAVDAVPEHQIDEYGGLHGVRNENALESAIAAAANVYYYGDGDVFEVAPAYAYHLAESQAYFDGNKRTGAQAALVFMEGQGIDTSRLPEQETYDAMIRIAAQSNEPYSISRVFPFAAGPEPPLKLLLANRDPKP